MARPKAKIVRAPKVAEQRARKPAYAVLDLKARTRLLEILDDPVFQQAWANAQMERPSAFTKGLNEALGNQIAANRLHEMRGWEMFSAALLKQTDDPKPARQRMRETYPDSGLPGAPE